MVRFDPDTESFTRIGIPNPGAQLRQILGRRGEVWATESAQDKLLVIHTR